jgi:hypothetical protein
LSVATPPTIRDIVSVRAGAITVASGVLFAAAVVFTYVLSLSEAVNPPTWVRIVGLVWLPIGLFGTPISYAFARLGPGRARGRTGIAIMLAGLLAFVVLLFVAG